MSIKYAEITIIRNLEEESIFRGLFRVLGYENTTIDKDTIIINFDDGTICDIKDEYIDKKYDFSLLGEDHWFPILFKKVKDTLPIIFFKRPKVENGVRKLNFQNIFKDCKNYNQKQIQSSKYNIIYQTYNDIEIFAICRIKSNEEKPRFLLAYDGNWFDRSDIIYLIDCILKHNFFK